MCSEGLLDRARRLGGRTLAELAAEQDVALPDDLRRHKGIVGHLVERALGGTPSGSPEPDFGDVELKTIPVDARGLVRESTFVAHARLADAERLDWVDSRVRRKLRRVLFVAVEADAAVPLRSRRVGAALLWTPTRDEEEILANDYALLMGEIGAGDVEAIDGSLGVALQLRPKGVSARARTVGYDADGAPFWAPKRAFYLRRAFTSEIFARWTR